METTAAGYHRRYDSGLEPTEFKVFEEVRKRHPEWVKRAEPVLYSGSGFTVPPLQSPFPSFRPRMNVPVEILRKNEAEVLKELNRALERLSLKPVESLQDVYRGGTPALLSYEPLDHYEGTRPEPYLGMPDYSHGADPVWPPGKGPKLFAYLRPGPTLPALMEALKESPARLLLRLSGVPARLLQAYAHRGRELCAALQQARPLGDPAGAGRGLYLAFSPRRAGWSRSSALAGCGAARRETGTAGGSGSAASPARSQPA